MAKMGAKKVRAAKKATKKATRKKVGSGICFTIMPFGGWFNDYYATVYRPAIETAGMKPHRADDLYRPSTIVNDIWSYTRQSRLILADLTGKNPNVFYELGLAHALAKPAILIAESMDDVPFDLRSLRVIEYDKNDPDWGETLSGKIVNAITEVLAAPLQAVLPAFLDVEQFKAKPKVSEREKEVLELKQDIESLRTELRSRSTIESSGRVPEPEEAKERIRNYLARGVPPSEIVSRLTSLGVPRGWVERKIEQLRFPREELLSDKPDVLPVQRSIAEVPLKPQLTRGKTIAGHKSGRKAARPKVSQAPAKKKSARKK